jgi:Flp pilus assembly protein TadG
MYVIRKEYRRYKGLSKVRQLEDAMKTNHSSERGQALILIVFAAVALIGITGLAVDGGNAMSEHRQAQNAADAAALAAARAKVRGSDIVATGESLAATYNFNNDGSTDQVEVRLCSDAGATCGELDGDPADYVQVVITSQVKTYFGRVVGWDQTNDKVEAIARGTTGLSTELFDGNAIVALSPNANPGFLVNSGASITVENSGIFVNSSSSHALLVNGPSTIELDAPITVVGGKLINGSPVIHPGVTTGYSNPYTVPPDLSMIPAQPSPPTCSGSGYRNGNTLYPGNWGSLVLNSGDHVTMLPGNYCFSGGFTLNGHNTLTATSGKVALVMGNQSFIVNSDSQLNFSDLEIYTNNGNWTINSCSITVTASRLRFYSTGSGQFIVNSASVSSDDAFFYLQGGQITWNSDSTLNLHAPPQGDPFGGLLIYMPWSNTSSTIINSGSDIDITGTILTPHSDITFNGGSICGCTLAHHSQIIGYTFIVNDRRLTVEYDAAENFGASGASAVELIK